MTPLAAAVAVAFLAYFIAVAYVSVRQVHLVFPRTNFRTVEPELIHRHKGEEAWLTMADGTRLHGVTFSAPKANAPLIICFPGQTQNALALALRLMPVLGKSYTLAAFNYRGHGYSEGIPSQEQLLADSASLHDQLTEALRPSAVYALGFSLGSSMAAHLSAERQLDGVILLAPFDSILNVARQRYWWLPVRWLLKHHFDTTGAYAHNPTPTALIAAELDEKIPSRLLGNLRQHIASLVVDETLPHAKHDIFTHDNFNTTLTSAMKQLHRTSLTKHPNILTQGLSKWVERIKEGFRQPLNVKRL